LTRKGAKDVHVVTSSERGGSVSIIACCDAEGIFLPPVLIMKAVRQGVEISGGLPPDSELYLNSKSSHICEDVFQEA
jgi:hypothetical protein